MGAEQQHPEVKYLTVHLQAIENLPLLTNYLIKSTSAP
jgi:hypothetical protein